MREDTEEDYDRILATLKKYQIYYIFIRKLRKIKPGCEFVFTAKIIGKLF